MATELKMVEVEVWVRVNEREEWEIGCDADDLETRYSENVGADEAGVASRLVKVTVSIPVPTAIEVTAVIPPEPSDAVVKVA